MAASLSYIELGGVLSGGSAASLAVSSALMRSSFSSNDLIGIMRSPFLAMFIAIVYNKRWTRYKPILAGAYINKYIWCEQQHRMEV